LSPPMFEKNVNSKRKQELGHKNKKYCSLYFCVQHNQNTLVNLAFSHGLFIFLLFCLKIQLAI